MSWKRCPIALLVFCCSAFSFIYPQQVASLHPNHELLWQRVSPSSQKPDGPVLYQLLFSASGTPGTLAEFDTNPRHLKNSDITDNGGIVAIGASGLTFNASTGIINFVNAQPLPGGPFLPLAGGTLTGALNGTSASFSGNLSANNITSNGVFMGNGSGLTNVNAAQLNGQAASFYQQRIGGVCGPGTTIASVNADGTVMCASPNLPRYFNSTNLHIVLDNTFDTGRFTSIAIGVDGFPIISYAGVINGGSGNSTTNLNLVHCTAMDCSTHEAPLVLDSTTNAGQYASITIGTDGLPIISYLGMAGNNGNLSVMHCTTVNCSTHGAPIVPDTAASAGHFTSITIGNDGFPIISYAPNNMSVTHCTAIDCSTHSAPIALDSTNGVANLGTSITIGVDGMPIVSYMGNGGVLSIVRCTAGDCSAHSASVVLDNTAGGVGGYSSITVGTDGFPIISYQGSSAGPGIGNLSAVHCTATDCSTHTGPFLLDNAFFAGNYTSITIGSDGLPIISYQENIQKAKVLHCSAADCSAHTGPIVLESSGIDGAYSSITIGTDGLPIISYQGFSSNTGLDNLSTVHCATVSCAPPYVRRR